MKHLAKKSVLLLALASLSFAASAHRGWMLPSASFVEKEEAWVTIDGAISEGLFEFDHVPLRMDGVTVTGPDGVTAPAPVAVLGKLRSTLDLRLPQDGTYRIAMVSNNVMGSYKVGGETRRFRGTEQSVAKEIPAGATDVQQSTTHTRMETFVSANKLSNGALKPSGQGLELVPITHPNDLRAGEPAKFRFQLDGKPLANFPFSMVPAGVKYRGTINEIRLSTDAKGEASFTLPAPNRYWLSAKYPVDQGKGPGEPGSRRYAYSATFEILPE
ncbi:DUF4198 domain-containing protein [Massilia sp. MS-15]|uniref:DUF4198 domain-containing protein n=1 Tax=Massilia sp. MS-15 TaxID=2878200 RepID=UPI001CD3FB59|nr:DUF4198 domain-containing protein [Massilia sp. MS-15]MCA1245164.1 DUF4198 domain-containing protein [Massilia sp. MS-15]